MRANLIQACLFHQFIAGEPVLAVCLPTLLAAPNPSSSLAFAGLSNALSGTTKEHCQTNQTVDQKCCLLCWHPLQPASSKVLQLSASDHGWSVGDRILLASSSYNPREVGVVPQGPVAW